jgi:hypothetical protein
MAAQIPSSLSNRLELMYPSLTNPGRPIRLFCPIDEPDTGPATISLASCTSGPPGVTEISTPGIAPFQQQLFIYSARRIFGNSMKAKHPDTSDCLDGPVEPDGVSVELRSSFSKTCYLSSTYRSLFRYHQQPGSAQDRSQPLCPTPSGKPLSFLQLATQLHHTPSAS